MPENTAIKPEPKDEVKAVKKPIIGVRVSNHSTVPLVIDDVKIPINGSAFLSDFDESTKKHAAFIKAGMISVETPS